MSQTEKIALYYFSATGNSLKLSLDVAAEYEQSEIMKISKEKVQTHPTAEIVGFIFPVYMGGIPKIVYDFLQNFPFRSDIYYFSIGTYYTYKGCAMPIVSKILQRKGVKLSYGNYLPSVGNCLMEYNVSQKQRLPILKRAKEITSLIIEDIKQKREKHSSNYCRLSEKVHNGLFNLFFRYAYKKFALEVSCNGCGVCAKMCPVKNITISGNIPQWGASCDACHACVHWCPQNAINLGGSKGRLQYQNPQIKRKMLY